MVDLNNITLTEIVKLVKLKKVSSLELTNHYIKNIEKGKKLNCFITTCFDETIKKSKTFVVPVESAKLSCASSLVSLKLNGSLLLS